ETRGGKWREGVQGDGAALGVGAAVHGEGREAAGVGDGHVAQDALDAAAVAHVDPVPAGAGGHVRRGGSAQHGDGVGAAPGGEVQGGDAGVGDGQARAALHRGGGDRPVLVGLVLAVVEDERVGAGAAVDGERAGEVVDGAVAGAHGDGVHAV